MSNTQIVTEKREQLRELLRSIGPIAVAVSGGVDSLTLATIAHETPGVSGEMVHAVSAAVPAVATQRVRAEAIRQGWSLHEVVAGEFDDERYLANPVDRCFYCKSNLYERIAELHRTFSRSTSNELLRTHTIVSGANLDDLSDYRPGLRAAENYGVRHPFVEVGADKATVRALARMSGLGEIAELVASPCLSSRVETGISIQPRMLRFVEEAEAFVTAEYNIETVRCRVRSSGVVIELLDEDLRGLSDAERVMLLSAIGDLAGRHGQTSAIALEPYRRGSAFLHV